jgi:hypothetical protein
LHKKILNQNKRIDTLEKHDSSDIYKRVMKLESMNMVY